MVLVVLPAYNEAENMRALVEGLSSSLSGLAEPYRIAVVNDGSTDATGRLVEELARAGSGIDLINHPRNLGLAAALRTGLRTAVEQTKDEDVVVVMDADNTHPPALIEDMLREIRGGRDLVIASRFRPGAKTVGVPVVRQGLSLGASLLFRMLHPFPGVRDYTSGYRAYRAGLLKEAFRRHGGELIDQAGFGCMAALLLKLKTLKPRVVEVPLVLRYDQKRGQSKMRVLKTVWETVGLLLRRR
jgi:dolichol-phosphate mannosyltransferase